MNVADMGDIETRLDAIGGFAVDDPRLADMVLVNTCTVRAKAAEKADSYFGELKHLAARNGKSPLLVGMGCAVNLRQDELKQRFPHLNLLLDFSDPDSVIDALKDHLEQLPVPEPDAFTQLPDTARCLQHFVTAIRGCQHGCSYCIVPRARGSERDVPLRRIIAEAKQLEAAGAPSLTVLGQNILAYGNTSGDGSPRFIELMETLLAETGFRWITFLTSLASDLTDEICERIIAHSRITPLLHLPLQSGSDPVLLDMRRGYTADYYRRMIAKARDCRPDLYVTTDLLVGFPTESEADYQATLALVKEIGFDDAFMFAYSERPGSPASIKFPDTIPRAEKLRRLNALIKQQRTWGAARNRRYLGQELPALIERVEPDSAVARTAFNKPVRIPSTISKPGEFTAVKITGVRVSSFNGEDVGCTS